VANIPQHLQESAREQIDENLQDQEEEEHLPEATPESEDVEEEENGRNEEDGMECAPPQADSSDPAAHPPDPEGRMPGQLPTQSESESAQPDYANLKRLAKEKIRGLLGTEVTCRSANKTMVWKVISEHEPADAVHDEV
jgi:hypothetical protein